MQYARDFRKFQNWIQNLPKRKEIDDYWVPLSDPSLLKRASTLYSDKLVRWKEFPVNILVSGVQKGLSSSNEPLFEPKIAASLWNNNPTTPISLKILGSLSQPSTQMDGTNTISFNDPQNNIPGTFDCNRYGTVSQNKIRLSSSKTSFRNLEWTDIIEFDLILQDGIECLFTRVVELGSTASDFLTTLIGHELGHSLGLGHSCGVLFPYCGSNLLFDNALMGPLRLTKKPILNSDDLNSVEFVYAPEFPVGASRPTTGTTRAATTGTTRAVTTATTATTGTTRAATTATTGTTRAPTTGTTRAVTTATTGTTRAVTTGTTRAATTGTTRAPTTGTTRAATTGTTGGLSTTGAGGTQPTTAFTSGSSITLNATPKTTSGTTSAATTSKPITTTSTTQTPTTMASTTVDQHKNSTGATTNNQPIPTPSDASDKAVVLPSINISTTFIIIGAVVAVVVLGTIVFVVAYKLKAARDALNAPPAYEINLDDL